MTMKKVVLTAIVSWTFILLVNGQNSSNSQPMSNGNSVHNVGEESPLEKGAKPLYDLMHGFLDSVQKHDFVTANSDSKISYKEIQNYIVDGSLSKLADRWQDMVSVFGGYAACIVVGLLFVIFMPIIGMFFCCCYCCCKRCGKAREKSDPKSAGCKRATYCLFLAIFTTMMLTGAIVSIISNELLHMKLENSDERGPVQYMKSGLDDLVVYASETTAELDTETRKTVHQTIFDINRQINGSVSSTVDSVVSSINASALLSQTENLGARADQTLKDLENITTTLSELKTKQNELDGKITAINQNLSAACNGISPCPRLPTVANNFTVVNDLATELQKVKDSVNISALTIEARRQFDKVVNDIYPHLEGSIDQAMNKSGEIQKNLENQISSLSDTSRNFENNIKNVSQTEIDRIDKYLKDYADYIWYGGIGIPCVVILTTALYYMGILFGLCGQRPGYDAPCCNRGTGSNFLVGGVVWTYLLFWLLMYIVLFSFLIGGLLYTNVCRNLNKGVENIGDFEPILDDMGIDVKSLLEYDSTSNFTIKQALKDCKNDKGIYSALKLQSRFNLDELLDISDVIKEIRELSSNPSFTVPNITILSDSLNKSLSNFANSGITQINFTSFEEQLNKTPILNVTGIITELENFNLQQEADMVTSLQKTELKAFEDKMEELRDGLNSLKTQTDLQGEVTELQVSLKKSQDNFNNEKQTLIKKGLNSTVDNVIVIVQSGVDSAKTTVRNIGNCSSVYTAAQKLSDSVCVAVLDPFNTFWFGLGWGIFFSIPSIIFALLLANVYQREDPFDKELRKAKKESRQKPQQQEFDSPMMETYQDNIPLTSAGDW
ncbi:prominin-1-like isoform X2 [Ostrea edulis]|uniref:prominin-1-like isoform X2 n=1 Tax=Ostrea edulis TaxID=37623 RepID=UPI0024AFB7FE|nr:prominin-1-like isoform X2 [Ostrea edulis]